MSESTIARRYAKALIEIAQDEGKVEPYRLELENFNQAALGSPELLKILANRFLPVSERMGIINELSQKLSLSVTVIHFLKFLMQKGRMDLFHFVTAAYRRFAFALQNREEALVTTAAALPDSTYEEIKKTLEATTRKTMVLNREIDPAVIAGICIRVGNEIYDGTVKTELDKLSLNMSKGVI